VQRSGDYTGITDFAQDLETHGAPSDRSLKVCMTDASSLQDDYNKVNDYIESVRRRFPSYQTINLVGHSMGGLVARKWATDHPGEVNVVITLVLQIWGSMQLTPFLSFQAALDS